MLILFSMAELMSQLIHAQITKGLVVLLGCAEGAWPPTKFKNDG